MESIKLRTRRGQRDAVSEYRQKLADAELPEKVAEAVSREIDRLERMSEQSPEHSWIRTWLDTMFDVPWETTSEDSLDLSGRSGVLDADHTGLDDVKDRIIEHLAVRKLRHERGLGNRRRQAAAPARSSFWSAPPASARPRWASRSPGPSVASSSGSPSAASATRPRSAATAAPTSGPVPAASSGP